MHGCMCIFNVEYACILTGVLSTMHVQMFTLNRCCNISVHICVHTRCRVCICAHVCAFYSFSVGEQGWVGSASLWASFCFAWGGYFWQKERQDDDCFYYFQRSLVPLIEGLYSSNPWEFEFSGFRQKGCCLCLLYFKHGWKCMWVYVCVYTHKRTHCTDRPGTRLWAQGSGWDTWRAQRIQTKSRHIYVRICVQSTHVYVLARRRDEILD